MDDLLLTGLWQRTQGNRYIWYGADWATFQARAVALAAGGFVMNSLDATEVNGVVSWTGAWESGTARQELASGLIWDELLARNTQLAASGLSLCRLRSHSGPSPRGWAGFWRAGAGTSTLVEPVPWSQFWATWQAQDAAGNRLVDFDTYGSGGARLWAGLWQPGTDDEYLWVGVSWTDFSSKNTAMRGQGYGLSTIRSYDDGNSRLWAGVWRKPSASDVLVADLTVTQFWDEWNSQSAQGLQLTRLHAWSGTAYAPTQAQRGSLNLHIKVLQPPIIAVDVMLERMREIYETVGISVNLKLQETLNLPDLLDINVGTCTQGAVTTQQQSLFGQRNSVGPSDIVVYFIRSTIPPFNGCSAYPDGRPGLVISSYSTEWTLAHEVGHVLGLFHVTDAHRLMTGGGTANIVNPPPVLYPEEAVTMLSSDRIELNQP
jgi:Bacterial tandem repeat domain 1